MADRNIQHQKHHVRIIVTTVARCSLDVATDKCGPATANNDDLLRQTAALLKKKLHKISHNKVHAKTEVLKYNN